MKQIIAFVASALLLASTAYASDLGGYKDAPIVAAKDLYSGLAIGVQGGGQFTAIDVRAEGFRFDGVSADGLVGGAHAEYLFASGRLRFGPWAACGLSDVDTVIDLGGGEIDALTMDYSCGGGVMAGVTIGESLLFTRIGYERQVWTSDLFEDDVVVDTMPIGGGVSTMISENWSLGISGDYVVTLGADVGGEDIGKFIDKSESMRARAELLYRF